MQFIIFEMTKSNAADCQDKSVVGGGGVCNCLYVVKMSSYSDCIICTILQFNCWSSMINSRYPNKAQTPFSIMLELQRPVPCQNLSIKHTLN